MLVSLVEKGLATRLSGVPRSIEVNVRKSSLPVLGSTPSSQHRNAVHAWAEFAATVARRFVAGPQGASLGRFAAVRLMAVRLADVMDALGAPAAAIEAAHQKLSSIAGLAFRSKPSSGRSAKSRRGRSSRQLRPPARSLRPALATAVVPPSSDSQLILFRSKQPEAEKEATGRPTHRSS
jgi:hypothetical protein